MRGEEMTICPHLPLLEMAEIKDQLCLKRLLCCHGRMSPTLDAPHHCSKGVSHTHHYSSTHHCYLTHLCTAEGDSFTSFATNSDRGCGLKLSRPQDNSDTSPIRTFKSAVVALSKMI